MPQNTRRYFEELGELPDARYNDVTIRRGRGPDSPEFGPIVKSKMGKPFEQLVTPELIAQSQHYGTPASHRYEALGGVNYASWLPPETIPHMLEGRLMELDPRGVQPGKRIFGIGSSASPDIWAHEYRHEDLRGNYNEWRNRIADTVFSATSFPAYRNAIRSFNEYRIISAGQGGDYQEVARLRKLYKDEPAMEASVLRELSSKSNLEALVRLAEKGGQPVSDFGRVGSRGNFIERNVNYNRRNVDVSKLSKDELKIRAYFPFLNFVGRIQGDQSMDDRLRQAFPAQQDPAPRLRGLPRAPVKKAGGGEVQAEPTESPLEAARRIRDSLISSSQRFAEGGEVKKEESPMASPVGGAKQMLAELESQDKKIAERKRPRSKESIEEERASKELDRGTLMSGSLVAPTIAREGDLTVRRFAGGGSVDKGKLTLEHVGGVEFWPANPAPRSLKDFVPGAADLPRSPPQKAPGWGDAASYNPQGLAYGFGTGIRNTLEGLASLPGTAADMLGGFLQREVRERSPEGMRGSAPAMDTTTYDAAKSALKEAAGNPVEAARNIRDSLVSYVRQGVATPQSTAQFIGENVNPLRLRGPVSRGPVLDAVRPSNYGVMLPQRRADGTSRPTVISEYRNKAMSHLHLKQDLGLDKEVARQIEAFLDTKPTNYFSRQMGTPKDPVLKNILAGQYRTPRIRAYFSTEMLQWPDSRAAAVRLYDDYLGFQSWVLNPNPSPGEVLPDIYGRFGPEGLAKKESIRQDIRGRIAAQGVPESEINFKKGLGFIDRDLLHYSLEGKDFLDSRSVTEGGNVAKDLYARYELAKMDPYRSSSLDPSVVTAIEKQEPIYAFMPGGPLESIFDPEALVDYLATLPPNKIKNIRFEDALRGATEVVKKRDVVQTTIQAIRDNKTVPRSVFDEGTRLVKMDVKDADPFSPPYTGEDAVQWRQIIDPEATRYESAYLKHSVDGYAEGGVFNYGPEKQRDFREGKVQLYSLRDKRGMPVTTVEVKTFLPSDTPVLRHVVNIPDDKPVQLVTQIRGAGRATGNASPPRWAQRAVVDLLRGPLKGIQVADVRHQIPDTLREGFPSEGMSKWFPKSGASDWAGYKKFKDLYDGLDPIQQYNYDQVYGKPDFTFPDPGDDVPQ